MESNLATAQTVIGPTIGSNIFSKSIISQLYQSYHTQKVSNLNQARSYDAMYRSGFPKLYSFETSV